MSKSNFFAFVDCAEAILLEAKNVNVERMTVEVPVFLLDELAVHVCNITGRPLACPDCDMKGIGFCKNKYHLLTNQRSTPV